MKGETYPRFLLRGVQDELAVYEDRITLTPRGVLGFVNKGMKGTKTIPLSSITAIQLKRAGAVFNGYIQITILGGNESTQGLFAATRDENSVMYKRADNRIAAQIAEYIQSRLGTHRENKLQGGIVNISDELRKLASLHHQGSLTDAEYGAAKARVIKGS